MNESVQCSPNARLGQKWATTGSRGNAVDGFGLVEVLVSSGLIIGLAAGVAQLAALTSEAVRAAGVQTTGLLLAAQKMEQLRSLRWGFDATGMKLISDLTTNLTGDLPSPGGRGLRASPPDSLDRSVRGYVDYLNARGRWLGTGTRLPTGTSYVRRWSVQPLDSAADDLLIIEVLVAPLRLVTRAGTRPLPRNTPGLIWLSSLKGRGP